MSVGGDWTNRMASVCINGMQYVYNTYVGNSEGMCRPCVRVVSTWYACVYTGAHISMLRCHRNAPVCVVETV